MISRTNIAASKVVLLTESNSSNQDVSSNCKYEQKLWDKLRLIVTDLHYCCETVELDKLDFQEYESVDKFLNAAIVIMVCSDLVIFAEKMFVFLSLRMLQMQSADIRSCTTKVIVKVSIVWTILY